MGVLGSSGRVVPSLLTVGVPEVTIRDMDGSTEGRVKGRKWGPEVTNASGLVIHGVNCDQGVATLWSQARGLRVGLSKTVVGVQSLFS